MNWLSAKASLVLGVLLLTAWGYLILVRHMPAGWPHLMYALGAMLLIRGIALRDVDA